jgi:hypothetical protein
VRLAQRGHVPALGGAVLLLGPGVGQSLLGPPSGPVSTLTLIFQFRLRGTNSDEVVVVVPVRATIQALPFPFLSTSLSSLLVLHHRAITLPLPAPVPELNYLSPLARTRDRPFHPASEAASTLGQVSLFPTSAAW